MYGIVRIAIVLSILIFVIILINKSKKIHKFRYYITGVVLSVVLVTVLAFIPFENLFVTFDSPKDVYRYVNLGADDVELIVDGSKSDFVVGEENNSNTYLIVPKTTDGWKVATGFNTNKIIKKVADEITIDIYQYKNTDDYFIVVFNANGGESQITDSCNSKFYSLKDTYSSSDKTYFTYYAHIKDFDSQYSINVNGNEIL